MNGVLGQFSDAETALRAVRAAREQDLWVVDAFSPFPVPELGEAVEPDREYLPAVVFCGGAAGAAGGFFLQYWAQDVAYPLNVGARPMLSWPSWIPVTFELTVLLAAFAAVFGLLALSGLPRPHHPLFEVEAFRLSSRDKFFVWLAPRGLFDRARARVTLSTHGAEEVYDVP